MSIDRLCFGTSTFVAGRLLPRKDSRPGLEALVQAMCEGLDWVHSNPALLTQWAVQEAWERAGRPLTHHAVKVESPLDSTSAIRRSVRESIYRSLSALNTARLHAAVIEIDLKGTAELEALLDAKRVASFHRHTADEALATGVVDRVFAYCHSPQHMAIAAAVSGIGGLAAQFSPAERWPRLFVPELEAKGLPFLGMAPLWRGRFTAGSGLPSTRPLTWALSHTQVTRAVITVSSPAHWAEVVAAAGQRYERSDERADFSAWGL